MWRRVRFSPAHGILRNESIPPRALGEDSCRQRGHAIGMDRAHAYWAMIQIARILCPVDFSEFSRRAVQHAVAMARSHKARLTVLHVLHNVPALDVPPIEVTPADRANLVRDMQQLLGATTPDVPIDFVVREARDVRREILDQIEVLAADLLVIGSHGRTGFEKLLLGSVAEHVLRKASCPVMVVPCDVADPVGEVRFARILCPVDFSPRSAEALTYASRVAEETGARLTVMHVIEIPPELLERYPAVAELDVDKLHAAARATAVQRLHDFVAAAIGSGRDVDTVVREGAAYRHILAVAAEQRCDLIVMGVQGRGAVDLFVFGSNTARVIRAATCPVLTIRPLERATDFGHQPRVPTPGGG
jgi:nucleotide-binding universal stress UspA family protein